jgi:hypothetical protein
MLRAMKTRWLIGLVLAVAGLASGGCGGTQSTQTTTAGTSEGPPPGGSNDNVPPAAVASADADAGAPDAAAGRDVTGQILVSGPGFSPPVVQGSGVAGGPTHGREGPSGCTGYFPDRPQHVLKVGRRIPQLRVMADGVDRDLTLAVHTPDGQWHCNDDSGDPGYGLNPAVDLSSAGPGEIEVFVGVFSESASGAQYTLGVTEDLQRYGSSLRPGGVPGGPPRMPGMPMP